VDPIAGSTRNTVVAIASRDADRAASYAAAHGIPRSFDSYHGLIDDPDVDAVYIALPNHLHAAWTIRALEAGKHVLCEKPLALTVEDVDRVRATTVHTGRLAMEAFMFLHHPQTKRAVELVHQGVIGELRTVQASFSFVLTHPGDPRLEPAMGGGSLWDVGGYPISLLHRLTGAPPAGILADARYGSTGVDLSVAAILRYPSGMLGQVYTSFETPAREHVEVQGSEGSLTIDPAFVPHLIGRPTTIRISRGDTIEHIEVPLTDPYLAEVENLAAAILGEADQELPLTETRDNVATLVAIHAAAREGDDP
jgi:predicted dehydrogenase